MNMRKIIHLSGVSAARGPTAHPPELLTIKEAAFYLRVCTKTVRGLISKGKLPASKVGKQIRIPNRSLQSYLGLGKVE
jgi:excisionase family DNA binding protein